MATIATGPPLPACCVLRGRAPVVYVCVRARVSRASRAFLRLLSNHLISRPNRGGPAPPSLPTWACLGPSAGQGDGSHRQRPNHRCWPEHCHRHAHAGRYQVRLACVPPSPLRRPLRATVAQAGSHPLSQRQPQHFAHPSPSPGGPPSLALLPPLTSRRYSPFLAAA